MILRYTFFFSSISNLLSYPIVREVDIHINVPSQIILYFIFYLKICLRLLYILLYWLVCRKMPIKIYRHYFSSIFFNKSSIVIIRSSISFSDSFVFSIIGSSSGVISYSSLEVRLVIG